MLSKHPRLGTAFPFIAALLAGPTPVRAQCADWLYSRPYFAPFHINGSGGVTTFTPTGAPFPRVVVAGAYAFFNGTDLGNIAQWDGSTWSALGSGISSQVDSVTTWNSPSGQRLIAGGPFDHAGGLAANAIASWNGSSWSALGTGIQNVQLGGAGEVLALTTWDPDGSGPLGSVVVAAGDFDHAGSAAANNIAYWDGAWHALGTGIDSNIWAVTTWDPDGPSGAAPPQIVVGGLYATSGGVTMNSVSRWDGTAWRALGTGLLDANLGSAWVFSMTSWDPDGFGPLNPVLVAAGYITSAGGTPAPGVAYWDGTSWHAMATNLGTVVEAVGNFNGSLVASGYFTDASGHSLPSPRVWNGSSWQTLGQFGDEWYVDQFATWDPGTGAQLVGAGPIFNICPNGTAQGVMHLANNQWQAFGPAPVVYAGSGLNGRIILGGQFVMEGAGAASNTDAFNLAAWNGCALSTPGAGAVTGTVRAIKSYSATFGLHNPEIVIGGTFGAAGGIFPVNSIARYVEGNSIIQNGWFAMGAGVNGTVYALERFGSSPVTIAGGSFTATGDSATSLPGVGQWNGAAWSSLGGGLNGTVYALKSYNGSLYAGGSFTTAVNTAAPAGNVDTGGLARWDGSRWNAVGGHFAGTVYALEVLNNELAIGGLYPGINSSPNLAKYNSTTGLYSTFGTGGTNAAVRALAVGSDGQLYIGGDFTAAGNLASGASYLARWNPATSTWSAADAGVNGSVYALWPFRDEIEVGGAFGIVGNNLAAQPAWTRFTTDGVPWLPCPPILNGGVSLCNGGSFSLYIYFPADSPSPTFPALTYSWRRNGIPLVNGPSPTGSTISSAGAYVFNIANLSFADAGVYDCVVSSTCGSTTSAPYTLTFPCIGDFNCSHTRTIQDLFDFLSAWFAHNPHADVNASGTVTVQDLFDFLASWFATC